LIGHVSNRKQQSLPFSFIIALIWIMLQTTQVWELWREDRALDIVDSSINESYVSHEVLRCIQIGLLCVQEDAMDRPTMSTVLLMLSSETTLPSPKQPAFIFRRPSNDLDSVRRRFYSINDVTITMVEAR
jgi:hypothetical protein